MRLLRLYSGKKALIIELSLIFATVSCDSNLKTEVVQGTEIESNSDRVEGAEVLEFSDKEFPYYTGDSSDICSDKKYYDRNQVLQSGTRQCDLNTLSLKNCARGGEKGCVANDSFPSVTLSEMTSKLAKGQTLDGIEGSYIPSQLSPENIRSGVTILGVTGAYPSSAHPLSEASSTPDLTNFSSQITSGGTFEFFDSAGERYTAAGDSDIIAANVAVGVSLENLGISGSHGTVCTADGETGCLTDSTYKAVDTSGLSQWDLRLGTSAGGISGRIKTSCRNAADISRYQSNSLPDNNGSTDGGAVNWWDTLDNFNDNDDAVPSAQPASWAGGAFLCGVELWSDVTDDSSGDGTGACDSAGDDCVMKDNVTGLFWTESGPDDSGSAANTTTGDWSTTIANCDGLTSFGGYSDWRVPTFHEMQTAAIHGIRLLGYRGGLARPGSDSLLNNDFFIADVDSQFWTATTSSMNPAFAHWLWLGLGEGDNVSKGNPFGTICVR